MHGVTPSSVSRSSSTVTPRSLDFIPKTPGWLEGFKRVYDHVWKQYKRWKVGIIHEIEKSNEIITGRKWWMGFKRMGRLWEPLKTELTEFDGYMQVVGGRKESSMTLELLGKNYSDYESGYGGTWELVMICMLSLWYHTWHLKGILMWFSPKKLSWHN